jgi:hypothetical protein
LGRRRRLTKSATLERRQDRSTPCGNDQRGIAANAAQVGADRRPWVHGAASAVRLGLVDRSEESALQTEPSRAHTFLQGTQHFAQSRLISQRVRQPSKLHAYGVQSPATAATYIPELSHFDAGGAQPRVLIAIFSELLYFVPFFVAGFIRGVSR